VVSPSDANIVSLKTLLQCGANLTARSFPLDMHQ